MTPVGHTLFGATVGVLAMPAARSWKVKAACVGMCVVLASFPDLKVTGWGHDSYVVSHSVIVNGGMMVLIGGLIALAARLRGRAVPWRWLAAGAAAWASHFLLDALYGDRIGLRIFWPISEEPRLSLGLPWFEIMHRHEPLTSAHNLRVFGIELLFYGTILLAAVWGRYLVLRARNKPHRSADAA